MRLPPSAGRSVIGAAALAAAGCASGSPAPEPASEAPPRPHELVASAVDAGTVRELEPVLAEGVRDVEAFFALPFQAPFRVELLPDRAAFDASFPPEWGVGRTQCWMVATGVADALRVLSPRVWSSQACEHDPADAAHVRGILVHELVHVFHGQRNPHPDFAGMDDLGWLLEGLAVYASGQLEEGHLAEPAEAVAQGLAPARLEDAWSGKYRYGVSGSLVRYVDETFGRAKLRQLLAVTSEPEALAVLGVTEEELLAGWEESVRSRDTPGRP